MPRGDWNTCIAITADLAFMDKFGVPLNPAAPG